MALEAALTIPNGMMRVVTTHLEYFSARQRMAQVERLRAFHHEAGLQSRGTPPGDAASGPFGALFRGLRLVCLQGISTSYRDQRHMLMLEPFSDGAAPFCDAWEVAHGGAAHAPTVGVRDAKPFTFDFVFASADLAERIRSATALADIDGSDHQPVLVELA